jgi:hypothetical protein
MLNRSGRLTSIALAFVCTLSIVVATMPAARGAATSKQLRRVRGNVGYQPANAPAVTPLFGKIDLPDDSFAVTQADSVGELALPDSSIVTLGAATRVQVGAFSTTSDGPGSTILVANGTLRFDIKRPPGGHANYVFQTATSQIAVRGTIGLLSVINGVTTVACIQCAADSITVTVGSQTLPLATGQTLTIGAGGAVPGTLGPETISQFGASGVSTGAGAGAAATSVIPAVAAAAVLGGAIAVSAAAPTSTPFNPTYGHTPTPSPSPTNTPVPTPTPAATSTIPGSVVVTGKHRDPATASPGLPAMLPRIGR